MQKDDVIYRQDAIDALRAMALPLYKDPGCEDIWERDRTLDNAIDVMRGLLPAEPKTCAYWDGESNICALHRPSAQPERTDCEYCHEDSDGYVKPIEKNCHAFVRFGENGWELDLKANRWHGSAKIRYCPMCGRDLLVK